MMQFAVLHICKYKNLSGIGAHIDRKYISKNIDISKTHFNEKIENDETLGNILGNIESKMPLNDRIEEEFVSDNNDLEIEVSKKINEKYTIQRKIRSDAVKALGIIMTGSHSRMKEIEQDSKLFNEWKKANYEFACDEFGKDNIIRMTLHLDEKTPHFHCVFVPITSDGGLSAKHYVNGKKSLRDLQDRYAKKMSRFGLSRGIPVELSDRKHIDTGEYYQSINAIEKKIEVMMKDLKKENIDEIDDIKEKIKNEVVKLQAKLIAYKKDTLDNAKTVRKIEKDAFKQVLKENKKEEFKKALEIIKQEIPIGEFAVNKLGYEKDKAKSSAKHLVLKHHLNDKILVPTQKSKSGSWLYYEIGNDLKKGGSLIDLLLKNGWNWSDIKELTNENYAKALSKNDVFTNITTSSSEFSSQKQTQLAKNLFEEIINDKRINYLMKRSINPKIFKDFEQVRTNKFSAIFGLYTDFNKENPRLCSTIRYVSNREGITKKFFQKNLPRGLSILKNNQSEASRVIVTESPVDALSYRELEFKEIERLSKNLPDNEFIKKENLQNELENKMKELQSTMYISTCGSITEKIKEDLIPIFNKSSKVILAFDNDPAGKRMTKKLENILEEKNIKYQSIFPKQYKDWNDELSAIKNRNIIKISSNNEILKKTYEKIVQTDFKNSILSKSNINETTVKDFNGFKYDENRVVFKLYKYNAGKLEFNNLFSIGINDKVLEKKFFRDKNEGLVVLNKLEKPKKIVFACSPIDLLKYRQIDLANKNILSSDEVKNTTYISNCFNKSEKLFNQIEEIISMNKHKNVKFEIVTTKNNIHDLNKISELFKDQSIDYTKTEIKKDVSYFNGIANTIFSIASKLKYSRKTQDSDYDDNEKELIRGHRR